MMLRRQTIEAILRTPSPWIGRTSAASAFTIVCTVNEGAGCRFAVASWTDRSLTALTAAILQDLEWKTVEHAARRQAVVRCVVPAAGRPQAEIDLGHGFIPLPISVEQGE